MTSYKHPDLKGRPQTGSSQTFVTSSGWDPSQSHFPSSASSYTDFNYLFGIQDPTMIAPKANRNRRKSTQGPEHTKHRRTRSGCYTCRSRRVKCDEAHPICERCRKGGRECVYPETSTSKASSSAASKANNATHGSPGSSSDEHEEEINQEALESIPDVDEDTEDDHISPGSSKQTAQGSTTSRAASSQKNASRQDSETPSLVQDKGASPTPSTEGSIGYGAFQSMTNAKLARSTHGDWKSDWSHLPPDLQFYLAYFYDNVTHLHYSIKFDPENILQTRYIDAALENESLLYAIAGFAAFHRTLHNQDGKIQDFLEYYNKAVSLLLYSLKKGERRTKGMMLAILQLATIEEYLGDWVNLLGHQKAAYEILTELYTPETIMQDGMTRLILGWYMRFDVFAGLMAGFETVLSRQWFSSAQYFFKQQVTEEPDVIQWRIELAIAKHRLVATDMSLLFAKKGKGEISHDEFILENENISRRIAEWKSNMDPALQDSRYMVNDFSGARPIDPMDIVDPYIPGIIFSGPLWVMNIAILDWRSIDLMHKYQTALTLQTPPGAELGMKAYATCQLYEALEFWPHSPPGTVLACQASLGIACLFLPRDERHAMWARRKLATIEAHGYIYPYTFRTKMSDLFRDRSCMHWWLPNDEAYPPIIRSIRKFVEERTSPAKNLPAEDLRDMKAIFASLKLDDSKESVPPTVEKRAPPQVALGPGQDFKGHNTMQDLGRMNVVQGDAYELGFDDGNGFWGGGQNGGAFGIPKSDSYS